MNFIALCDIKIEKVFEKLLTPNLSSYIIIAERLFERRIHMMKKIYLKKPARLILAFILVILLSAMFMLLFQSPAKGDSIPEYTTILVSKGDTLWEIAKQFSTENEDIRNKISEIKEINNISSTIKVGQELKIRIK